MLDRASQARRRAEDELPLLDGDGREAVSRVIAGWHESEQPDARGAMEQVPGLEAHRSWALELAYEEYCIRQERGEPLNVSQYCRRFPTIHKSLARQLEVHQYVNEHPEVLDRTNRVRWPEQGDVVCNKFAMVEELGRGALARVYLCRQLGVGDRQVVVKMAGDGAYEADTLGKLKHPHIIPVYAVEVDAASMVSAICMPFYGRSTLCDVLDFAWGIAAPPKSSLPVYRAARRLCSPTDAYESAGVLQRPSWRTFVNQVIQIGVDLAGALEHAHANGVRHDDLKPSNVLITNDGHPLLMDFNLANDIRRPGFMTGGTLPYMSPEQLGAAVLGESSVESIDFRSDVFSLGAILYELLTGQLPFDLPRRATNDVGWATGLLERQSHGALPVNRRNALVNRGLSEVVMRCLEFDREKRPQSAGELCEALARQLRQAPRFARWYMGERKRVIPLTAIILVGGGILAYSASHNPHVGNFVRIAQGRRLMTRGDFAGAEAHFRTVSNGKSRALLGYCYLKKRQFPSAERAHREAQALGYESAGLYSNLGLVCVNDGRLEEALAFVGRALELEPAAVTPLFIRARLRCLRASVDLSEARRGLEDIAQVLEKVGPDGRLYQIMGILHSCLVEEDPKHIDLAVEYYWRAYRHGMDPRAVRGIHSQRVLDHPRIQELLQQEQLQVPFPFDPVVDPTAKLF